MLREVLELCGWEVDGTNSASRNRVIHILRFEKDCVIQEDRRNAGEIELSALHYHNIEQDYQYRVEKEYFQLNFWYFASYGIVPALLVC